MHFEIVSTIATQPNTGAAGAALTGDSLVVKNGMGGRGSIQIVSGWSSRQVAGFSQWVWPSSHDTTRNFRAGVAAAPGQMTIPLGCALDVDAQETLVNTIAGSNTAGDIEQDALLVWYRDFPGISMKCITPDQVDSQVEDFITIESSVAAVATGQYSDELITADSDLLRANRNYAILGMSSRTAAQSLVMRGPDFGNVRIGVPGNLRPELTSQFFAVLSRAVERPMIPVINSGNKSQTFIGFCADENAATTLVTAYLALLK